MANPTAKTYATVDEIVLAFLPQDSADVSEGLGEDPETVGDAIALRILQRLETRVQPALRTTRKPHSRSKGK